MVWEPVSRSVTVARPGEEASRLRVVGADVARAARLAMAAKYVDSLIVCVEVDSFFVV